MAVLVLVMLLVEAEDVAVVGGAAGRVGEDGVGLGEEGEGVGGRGVGGVGVWVVDFGELVEGPLGNLMLVGAVRLGAGMG